MREVTVRKGEPIDRASKRNKVKWRYSNKSEETASETAETPASAPEA